MFCNPFKVVCICLLVGVSVDSRAVVTASEYLPLADGNYWTYSVDGAFTDTGTVLPGATLINGVWTKSIQWSEGFVDYYTNDENGLRQHGGYDPMPPAETLTMSPPVVYLLETPRVSDVVNTSGTVRFDLPSISTTPFIYDYTNVSEVEGVETVTVPAGSFKTLRVRNSLHVFGISQGIPLDMSFTWTDWYAKNFGPVQYVSTENAETQTAVLTGTNIMAPLFASILPGSRSVQVGSAATAFSTLVNPSGLTATACGIMPPTGLPADFLYQATDPDTNIPVGTPNSPVTIAPEANQSFMFAFTPVSAFPPTEVELQFDCSNTQAAPTVVGLNTLLLSASATPVPDIVALAQTQSGDGIAFIDSVPGTGAFAVAIANVGTGGSIMALTDTGGATLQLDVSMCETDPATGLCSTPVQSGVVTWMEPNGTATFAVFLTSSGNIPFDPANNRVFVRFQDAGGVTRGSTSVAVRTP